MEQSTLPPRTPDLTSFTRFVVCCDGTTNDGVNKRHPRTNVARLARCISSTSGIRQDVDYMAGVGTGTSRINNLRDSMDGRGMSSTFLTTVTFSCTVCVLVSTYTTVPKLADHVKGSTTISVRRTLAFAKTGGQEMR